MVRAWRLACCVLSVWPCAAGLPARAEPPGGPAAGIEAAEFSVAAFSPDGGRIVTAFGQDVCIWDGQTGRLLQRLVGHETTVFAVAFSPDGKLAATGAGAEGDMGAKSVDTTARVWDVLTGKEIRRLPHDAVVFHVAFSPDGRQLLTSTRRNVFVWDYGARKVFLTRPALTPASFSPDGHTILTSGERYGPAAGDPAGDKGRVRYVSYAVAWDAATGKEAARFEGHTDEVLAQSFRPDGRAVVTASRDGTARTWDAATGRPLRVFRGHRGPVHDARFGPGGRVLVTASADGTVRVWDAESGEERRRFPTPGRALRASVGGGGDRVLGRWEAAGGGNGPAPHASLWDAGSGLELKRFDLMDGATAASFSPDGARLLVATRPAPVRDARSGRPAR